MAPFCCDMVQSASVTHALGEKLRSEAARRGFCPYCSSIAAGCRLISRMIAGSNFRFRSYV